MPRNGGRLGPTANREVKGVFGLSEQYQLNRDSLWLRVTPVVTGGTLTSDATHYYRTFTSNGTLSVAEAPLQVEYFILGGGGGGNGGVNSVNYGAAGAGGVSRTGSTSLASSLYPVVVGAGGPGSLSSPQPGVASSVFGFSATGGGGATTGWSGASNADFLGTQANGSVDGRFASVGGGAGAGGNASSINGGPGVFPAIAGSGLGYGGGGAGGADGDGVATSGGGSLSATFGRNALANRGGGGGGGNSSNAFSGGSGVVVVRYARSQID